ncbi:glycoside hydrolase family 43 protein [Salinibacterium sp. SWN248]|uniref:glycoside hydrolase family 43 protein n=1 Tax=Salinibacterium sp. SWN248 TaxID=2792056 RepID=UPI0018CF4093|nr:glycoside hydrolase family 43 protein [Salinibacterium sp. SWN248]MBH0023067.1 glycoside hydrolase family 43 protein [Salinibacterium sp. SWN248]
MPHTVPASPSAVVRNPIIPGFNPDPVIVRRGDDYYLATSTFEWFPAVQFHHSTDLANWSLIGHAITDDSIDLRGIPASGGVWAPCLTVEPSTGRFYLVFSVMKSQEAEVFDVDNYIIWADDILGPWSKPLYVNSLGFDSSLFHDDDGTKWLVTLEWETRPGHEHPGWIVAQQFDPEDGTLTDPVRIHYGSTDRGALEAPHLYKVDGRYYLMTAEGGTGYGHGVCLARADSPLGPYESDPGSPFITSSPEPYNGRNYRDFLRPEFFNPQASMQKAGHGSLLQAADDNWYVAHLSSRPLPGTTSSVLGRESSLQAVHWDDDGWLRMTAGGVLPQEYITIPGATIDEERSSLDVVTDFRTPLSPHFAVPRGPIDESWCAPTQNGLELRGRDSLHSRFDVSLVATRLRAFEATAEAEIEFDARHFAHAAGLTVYYDIKNYVFARISWSEMENSRTIALVIARSGPGIDEVIGEVTIADGPVRLRAEITQGDLRFAWQMAGGQWSELGGVVGSQFMSDDAISGFTGQFVGVAAVDAANKSTIARVKSFGLTY